MLVRTFTRHFVERWLEWRREFPCIEEVNRLIVSGQQLRPQLNLFQRELEGGLKAYTVLSEFWNDEAGVILRIDEMSGKAITIITAGRRKEFKPCRNAKYRR